MVSPLNSIVAGIQSPETGKDFLNSMAFAQNQAAQKQNMDIQAQQQSQNISEQDYLTALRKLKVINRMATDVKSLGADQRQAYVNSLNMDMLKGVGISLDEIKNAPLDDASLDNLISQTGAVIAQAGDQKRVQSSQILDDGTSIQVMSDGAISVKDPNGNPLQGNAAREAIKSAQEYGIKIAGQKSGTRKREELGAEAGMRPGIEADVTASKTAAEITTKTKLAPEMEKAIVTARETAQAEAAKQISQQGQLNKLGDADRLYNTLSKSDLDLIYGRGEAWYPDFFRSQKGIDLIAHRNQLVGMLGLAARKELQGQGTITDSEATAVKEAATILGNPNISPEEARKALDSAMGIIYKNAGKQFTGDQPTTTAPTQGGWSIKPLE